jgi:protein tyrosine/serine phosphatase
MTPRTRRRWLWPVILIVLVVGGAIWVWEEVLEDRVVPRRWGVVVPEQVYRSGQLHPALVRRTLEGNQIDLVVSLIDPSAASEADQAAEEAERQTCEALQIERRVYPLQGDGTGDIANYAGAIVSIVEGTRRGERVLVHCAAGSQRTGGVVTCFRVLVQGWEPRQALEEMARYDWDPDEDLIILDHLNDHMPELVAKLVEMGVLETAPDPLPKLVP